MSQAATLYSPEVLGLATSLAAVPLTEDLPLRGSARAPVCGSVIELGAETDAKGALVRIGMRVHACAIGQASAALFAAAAKHQDRAAIVQTLGQIETWLSDPAAPLPEWPGLAAIAPAREYPARHGAIMLPWKAALAALPSVPQAR
ncbi:MAG TPA: iron-sulfur cluster assembly scaffold protein [Novosphingobium sp.]|nr:iron-sulfur cluster assembly scaffold protein [Novosphingobium sp.]HQA19028.1 iron-sulfur cluster assembly scaffold protein [Novosphingobium sp.]